MRVSVKARYVFRGNGIVVPDGLIQLQGGTISGVSGNPDSELIDLGNVAVLPGLINAHAHLELSSFASPVGEASMEFPQWIWEIVQHRRNSSLDSSSRMRVGLEAVAAGVLESRNQGVAVVGDIATLPWLEHCDSELLSEPVGGEVFLELLGLSEDRIAPQLQAARRYLQDTTGAHRWTRALSPHAPYTVHPELLAQAVELSRKTDVHVAMHLAESLDEIELLLSGGGHFQQVLTDLEAWDPSAIPRGIRPLDYLRTLERAPRTLVIHGNFLDREEIEFLGDRSDHMSVVYCPRTHAYFGHGQYCLEEMQRAGVNVCLGTDSRASNPDLSLLAEMRHIARSRDDIALPDILHMGTLAGARSLGLEHRLGSISAGKSALLTCIELPEDRASDPHELVFHGEGRARLLPDLLADLT